ncbi:phospholipid scramblase 2-like [Eurosta solidaginis]|uniref:phospholipid scramblase 2-like n=1 Tax=Eurosta solidaginis TaxID=178769 RepID=UPI00353087B5
MHKNRDYEGVPQDAPPIVRQPRATISPQESWMSIPIGIPNCPTGLEYLTAVDQLLIKQQVDLVEVFFGCEMKNKSKIKNSAGENVYLAVEDTHCLTRNLCGSCRPFDVQVLDNFQNEVLHIYRPLRCDSCCFPCCLQSLEVSSPPGTVIGSVEQEWALLRPLYLIKNAYGENVLRVRGPRCTFKCCANVDFEIFAMNGDKIGKISKQWNSINKEIFTDADYFGVTFPIDLDVRMKAVILAATFLIDMVHFEY